MPPLRGGENHARPQRPRPAVCASAIARRPSQARRHPRASFVDPIVEKNTIADAKRPRRGRARSIALAKSATRSRARRAVRGVRFQS